MHKKSRAFNLLLSVLIISYSLLGLADPQPAYTQTRNQSRQLEQLGPVTTLPGPSKRWALVIGVDQYHDQQISPLKGAANDAGALKDALVRYAGFPSEQVILLSTDQPEERQPTRLNILRRLSNLALVVPKDGLLLVSFAGHGMERNEQAYLLPSDAQVSEDITFLEEAAINVNRMKERIKAIGVRQVMILLDACRNDPVGRVDAPNLLTPAYLKGFNFDVRNGEVQAFAVLYATAVGQRAYEYTEKRHGYFTWAIIEGLKGGAANDKGEVTLSQLVRYVQEKVPRQISIDLGASKRQIPFADIVGYRADDLIIAVTEPKSPEAPATIASSASIELMFWDSIKNSNDPEDFKEYLEKYPNGQFASLARRRIQPKPSSVPAEKKADVKTIDPATAELNYWETVKNSANLEDFRNYLEKYPNGRFASLARERLRPKESPQPSNPSATKLKESIYQRFVNNRQSNPKVAYDAAREYLSKFSGDHDWYTEYLKIWTASYEKASHQLTLTQLIYTDKNYASAFSLGKQMFADDPDNLKALIDLGFAGYSAAAATKSETYNAEAIGYAGRAIQLIESGKAPDSWSPFKGRDDTLAYLYYAVGVLNFKNNPVESIPALIKTTQFESDLKKSLTSTYYLLATAYESGRYKSMAADYVDRFQGRPETDESKLALANLSEVIDRIIDAYARAVATAGTDPKNKEIKDLSMKRLTELYKFRHDNSEAGLEELIRNIMSKPLPGS